MWCCEELRVEVHSRSTPSPPSRSQETASACGTDSANCTWLAGRVSADELDVELSKRRVAAGENRLPPACAVVAALIVYALLPQSVLFTGRLVIPVLEVLLLVALLVTNPWRMTHETRFSRWASGGLATVVILTNLVSLGLLVSELSSNPPSGGNLLIAAMQIWVTNVIGFALLFGSSTAAARSPEGGYAATRWPMPTGASPRTRTTTPCTR
jgi:hypothetical protein